MAVCKWALPDGTIEEAEYDKYADVLSGSQVYDELTAALSVFGKTVGCTPAADAPKEVYEALIPKNKTEETLYISIKEMTPGGREALKDEQRIQQKAVCLSYIYDKRKAGDNAITLGVYKRGGVAIFCAWKPIPSMAASPNMPLSKQIKIDTIATAMREGFAQQGKGSGQYACAFRKEFFYFYVKNAGWIHDAPVTELNMHLLSAPPTRPPLPAGLKDRYNRIVFGAPGTGKSHRVQADCLAHFDGRHYERVTFHPNYSYGQFVGTYKPVPEGGNITYRYVPGPLIRMLESALRSPEESFLLVVEEINRANVAAVFGDVFQLLDRKDGVSEYPIETSADLRGYLAAALESPEDDFAKIVLPANLYIWATMNSADQGVFPMDTAFKRRWDFEYLGIDEGSAVFAGKTVELPGSRLVEWNRLRAEINRILVEQCRINEDKLIGPFFLGTGVLDDAERFRDAFKSKLLMYLYEDAAKQHRGELFKDCGLGTYSAVCEAFDLRGEGIFGLDLALPAAPAVAPAP